MILIINETVLQIRNVRLGRQRNQVCIDPLGLVHLDFWHRLSCNKYPITIIEMLKKVMLLGLTSIVTDIRIAIHALQ